MPNTRRPALRDSPPLSLLHLVNEHSANVGNGALTEGAELVLTEDIRSSIHWERLAWDDYTFGVRDFDSEFVAKINDESDGMIVGGAVAINGREFYANTGMRFNLAPALWRDIRRPIVFYGLSYRHWDGQTYHHADKLRWTLEHILDRDDMLLGLRNDGTREWLETKFNIVSDRFHVIPDPAVFLPADAEADHFEFESDRRNVILAFNDEDWVSRYGTSERRFAVLRAIALAIEKMLVKWDVNLILVPHYFDDCRMVADFIDLCKPALAHQRMIATGLARIKGSRHFYGRYRSADMVISMRVHSMSPCIGLQVPMIPLVTQDRMTDFLDGIGLKDLQVDAFDAELTDRLSAAIDYTLENPVLVSKRFAEAHRNMREQSRLFNAKIATLLGVA
jgi:polysaccharide pyruvyl transferase WcaK-like protein